MRFINTVLFVILVSVSSFAQLKSYNTTFLSNVKFPDATSGMWGFTQDGIDYAVIGTEKRTMVFSIADPKSPVKVYDIAAANSIWREARYHKKHIYVTNEQPGDGIVIIDMTDVSNITHTNFRPKITLGADVDKEITDCHAINMDSKGLLSLTGCNVGVKGVLMFDVDADPKNPRYLGATNLVYAHDTYNDGDTMYVSEISAGRLGIYNIKDKANPTLISATTTSKAFTHNAWTSVDKKYIFSTDEREGAWVDAYDITDLTNLVLVDRYQISTNLRSIPHNTYNNNDYLVTSWYTEGIRIIDVHRPQNMVEVAGYDTWEDPSICHAGFHGCWGVYPFAQNNLVFGSDIENGLYVISVDYKRACYFEGKVFDSAGKPIVGAKVEIISNQLNGDVTNATGEFKTGLAEAGTYTALITHPDYATKEISFNLVNGEITLVDVTMIKEAPATLNGTIVNTQTVGVAAKMVLSNAVNTFDISTDATGAVAQANFKPGTYTLNISSWGFQPIYEENVVIDAGSIKTLNYQLQPGFADNFELDNGWSIVNGGNPVGAWYRGVPRQTVWTNGLTAAPATDSPDKGSRAYITGSAGTPGASCDDLDNGKTAIYSPVMDLTKFTSPVLSFDGWFFNAGGNSPINDTMTISIFDGVNTVAVEKVYGITGKWNEYRQIQLKNFATLNKTMQLVVTTEDMQSSGHILEAGFDNFSITEGFSSSNDVNLYDLTVTPNPANDFVYISLGNKTANVSNKYVITNALGQNVMAGKFGFHSEVLSIQDLSAGYYIINVDGHKPVKLVKL